MNARSAVFQQKTYLAHRKFQPHFTHGLGPACQLLDIHRGDKMNYLVAMDTKSVNGLKLAKEKMGAETFANADQTLTLIKTEKGWLVTFGL